MNEDKFVEAVADNAPSPMLIFPALARLPLSTRPSESDCTELIPLKTNAVDAVPVCNIEIASISKFDVNNMLLDKFF